MSAHDSISSEGSRRYHRRQNSFHDLSKHSQLNQSSVDKKVDESILNNSEIIQASSKTNLYNTDNEQNLNSNLADRKNLLTQNLLVPDINENILKS